MDLRRYAGLRQEQTDEAVLLDLAETRLDLEVGLPVTVGTVVEDVGPPGSTR